MLWTLPSSESSKAKLRGGESLAPRAVWGSYGAAGVLSVTAAYLGVGLVALAAWLVTGNIDWVVGYFRIPGAVLIMLLTAARFWCCRKVLAQFSQGELMHRAWLYVTASAGIDLSWTVMALILGTDSPLNPLPQSIRTAGGPSFLPIGELMGGTCRFTLLALGLWFALKAYRKSGLMGRLNYANWLALMAMGVYVALKIRDIGASFAGPAPVWLAIAAGWPVDPFLWLLLAQAMLLYRSARQMGPGWVPRCWNAIAVGVFLVILADAFEWACNWQYLPWQWSAAEWYIWPAAATAFALAPAYQLEAIHRAHEA